MPARKRTLTEADRRAAAKVRELWVEFKKKHPGLSQETAAGRCGMTQSAFSQFLVGAVPMRVTPILKFAKLFGVAATTIRPDIGELAYATGQPTATELKAREKAVHQELSNAALEIARIYDNLEPQSQHLIREQIYIYSVIDHSFPWLRRGRPKGESYDAFEKRHEQNMRVQLALEAQRQHKAKS